MESGHQMQLHCLNTNKHPGPALLMHCFQQGVQNENYCENILLWIKSKQDALKHSTSLLHFLKFDLLKTKRSLENKNTLGTFQQFPIFIEPWNKRE